MASEERSTHARDAREIRLLKSRADRVGHIADVMEALEWVRGKSGPPLAKIWGVSEATVRDYAAEASRRITGDVEDARRDITAGCKKLFKHAVDALDAKSAKMTGELWAAVSGAKAPEKHQHGMLDSVTPESAASAVREAFGAHGSIDAREPANSNGAAVPSAVSNGATKH